MAASVRPAASAEAPLGAQLWVLGTGATVLVTATETCVILVVTTLGTEVVLTVLSVEGVGSGAAGAAVEAGAG